MWICQSQRVNLRRFAKRLVRPLNVNGDLLLLISSPHPLGGNKTINLISSSVHRHFSSLHRTLRLLPSACGAARPGFGSPHLSESCPTVKKDQRELARQKMKEAEEEIRRIHLLSRR